MEISSGTYYERRPDKLDSRAKGGYHNRVLSHIILFHSKELTQRAVTVVSRARDGPRGHQRTGPRLPSGNGCNRCDDWYSGGGHDASVTGTVPKLARRASAPAKQSARAA